MAEIHRHIFGAQHFRTCEPCYDSKVRISEEPVIEEGAMTDCAVVP